MSMTVRDLRRMLDGLDPGARIRARTDTPGRHTGKDNQGQSFRIVNIVPWERASGASYIVIHLTQRNHP